MRKQKQGWRNEAKMLFGGSQCFLLPLALWRVSALCGPPSEESRVFRTFCITLCLYFFSILILLGMGSRSNLSEGSWWHCQSQCPAIPAHRSACSFRHFRKGLKVQRIKASPSPSHSHPDAQMACILVPFESYFFFFLVFRVYIKNSTF